MFKPVFNTDYFAFEALHTLESLNLLAHLMLVISLLHDRGLLFAY